MNSNSGVTWVWAVVMSFWIVTVFSNFLKWTSFVCLLTLLWTHTKVLVKIDSIDRNRYYLVLWKSDLKSREIVCFSVVTTNVWSPKVSQLASPPVPVSNEYISMFFRVYLEENGEKREKREKGRGKGRQEECRQCTVEWSQNSAVEEEVSSENQSVGAYETNYEFHRMK